MRKEPDNIRTSRKISVGQVSMEYLMLTAAMLLILLVIMLVFMGNYSQQSMVVQQRTAAHSLSLLAASAQEVWVAGVGAEEKISLEIPESAQLASSHIAGHVMSINLLGVGDVSRSTSMNISGSWPANTGQAYMSVYNNGTHILIRPGGRLVVNITGIYMRIPTGGASNATTLLISNRAGSTYTLTQVLTCPGSTIVCTYDGTNGALAAEGTQTATVTISSNTPGLHTGYLNISAVPTGGSGLADETIYVPVTIRVE